MSKRLMALLSILIVIIFLTNGCGSGGGSGRYTVPPEIGPGGGTGGGGGGGGGGDTGDSDPEVLAASAWEDFRYGAFSSAINKFNQIINMSDVTDEQKIDAYNGLGWSLAKSAGIESGYSAFSQAASTNNEAGIGLASALIARGQSAGINQALQILEQIGLGNTAFRFQSTHPIGVSSAEAHAMLAFCYYWRSGVGDEDKARAQINVAWAEENSGDSSVAQIRSTLISAGLTGI